MPRFFLHIRRGRDYALGREGHDFPSVEVARHESLRAAYKAWRTLPAGHDPSGYSLEVEHESGVMVLSLPFTDVMEGDPLGTR